MRIFVDEDFWDHPKLHRLASALAVDPLVAGARLCIFWGWVRKFHEAGLLGDVTPAEIGAALRIPAKDATAWWDALTNAGHRFIDIKPNVYVHDWLEHQGSLFRERAYQRARRAQDAATKARIQADPTGEALKEALAAATDPVAGLLQDAAFCRAPGLGAKRTAFEDLIRRGIDVGTITAHLTDPAKRSWGFYEILKAIEKTKGNGSGTWDDVIKKAGSQPL